MSDVPNGSHKKARRVAIAGRPAQPNSHSEQAEAPAEAEEGSSAPAQPASAPEAAPANADRSPTERAEEIVDRVMGRFGHYTGMVGRGMLRFAARLREEAEDILAEAHDVRRHNADEPPAH